LFHSRLPGAEVDNMTKPILRKERWTSEEEGKIGHLQTLYGKKWTKLFAGNFPTRSIDGIRNRWYAISKKLWVVGEDKQLIDIVNGAHFETTADMKIWWEAASVSIESKTTNQCIDHWFSNLRPSRTELEWKTVEDKKLLVLCSCYGNKWKAIAQFFPRRSLYTIKKRWQVINKMKGSDDVDKSTDKNVKERATALLKRYPTSKLLLQESNFTQELSPKSSIPAKKAIKTLDTNESKLSTKRDIDNEEALAKALSLSKALSRWIRLGKI